MNYKKIKILRTNALIGRPKATLKFGNDNCIVIPMPVIDELEKEPVTILNVAKTQKMSWII